MGILVTADGGPLRPAVSNPTISLGKHWETQCSPMATHPKLGKIEKNNIGPDDTASDFSAVIPH